MQGSSLHWHPSHSHLITIVTCCVSGKSSIRAQHGFGTSDSWSLSSPTTSTKRQLSSTPRLFINWNHIGRRNMWKCDEILQYLMLLFYKKERNENTETKIRRTNAIIRWCLKMLRWQGTTTPFQPRQWEQCRGNDDEETSAFPGCSHIPCL